ncbi:MAG: exodeoxyribonuclease VII small subunit [Dermatophilaceae bacterium]
MTSTQGSPDTAIEPSDPNADIAAMRYEDARDELAAIVARLESGQVGLEESMGLWERGEALAKHCDSWLDQAQSKVAESE